MATFTPKPNTPTPRELHACMGLNACKGHDRYGDNDCAGMGYCATVQHTCHTLNNCRGQGGCGLYGTAQEQSRPGLNDCAWLGSCATPINSERFISVWQVDAKRKAKNGETYKGESVWKRARQVFEEHMKKVGRQVGPSPMPDGPGHQWLQDSYDGDYASCGASGLSGGGSCV